MPNSTDVAVAGHAVVIAGGGPTGLMLAGELALAGIDVVVAERRRKHELDGTRSRGLHARTIEVLDQRGIAGRFLAEGRAAQVQGFAMIPLDISDFPSRHPHGLALGQKDFERILGAWVAELGVPVRRGYEVTGFAEDDDGLDIELSDGRAMRASFLVGCDGGRSLIRKVAGIGFPGWDPSVSSLIAEVETSEAPEWGIRRDGRGQHGIGPAEGRRVSVVVSERYTGQTGEPTLADLSRAMTAVWGTDFGVHSPASISRFTDMSRQADSYRKGRVMLAGDACHVHYPVGGQGLNLGVQDAVNLGWKLAQVVKGISPLGLLDTYHAERHPVAARALRYTMAQTAMLRSDDRIEALRDTLGDLLAMAEPRRQLAGMVSGLDLRYDLGGGHPLVGRRMPDLDVLTEAGAIRVYTLLHRARPVLLDLGEPDRFDASAWGERVTVVHGSFDGDWDLPVVGRIDGPDAVLVRPDGYVAWAGQTDDPELPVALTTWFGG